MQIKNRKSKIFKDKKSYLEIEIVRKYFHRPTVCRWSFLHWLWSLSMQKVSTNINVTPL